MSEKNSKDKPNLGSMGRLSPGEMLCRARKEKGLAVEEVILHLGITQRTLNALEKDEYEALPSPLYVKGYIRRYCSILNMPDTEVLADFDKKVKELGLVNKEPSIRLDRDSSRKRINWKLTIPIILVLLLLVILILWVFLSKTADQETKELPLTPQESTRPEPLMNSGVSARDQKEIDTSVIDTKDIDAINKSALAVSIAERHNAEANFVEIELQKTKQTIAEPATLLRSKEKRVVTKGSQILQINVTKQSWIQILDAKGDILLADLKPSGYQKEVKGTVPFEVTLGYAPGVELTLNGKKVDIPIVGNNNTAKLKVGDEEGRVTR
jgi:cytoskeleton protein RodZ